MNQVLDQLESEGMYPEWRRQALEDTYFLFYEDAARRGVPLADTLPRPAVSTGEARHAFETGSRLWKSSRWEYEICTADQADTRGGLGLAARGDVRNGVDASASPESSRGAGRKIVPKGSRTRYCACAVDPLDILLGSVSSRSDCAPATEEQQSRQIRSRRQQQEDHLRSTFGPRPRAGDLDAPLEGPCDLTDARGALDSVSELGRAAHSTGSRAEDGYAPTTLPAKARVPHQPRLRQARPRDAFSPAFPAPRSTSRNSEQKQQQEPPEAKVTAVFPEPRGRSFDQARGYAAPVRPLPADDPFAPSHRGSAQSHDA